MLAAAHTVCLLSSQPALVSEFQRISYLGDFQLLARVLNPHAGFDLRTLQLPHASLFAVDARPSRTETQALVVDLLVQFPEARLLVLAANFTEATAFPLLALGVRGLLRHADVRVQLPAALRAIQGRGFWVPRSLLARFVDSVGAERPSRQAMEHTDLSESENAILEGVNQNLSDAEIAHRLYLDEDEVQRRLSGLMGKFGVRRRADLVLLGYQSPARFL